MLVNSTGQLKCHNISKELLQKSPNSLVCGNLGDISIPWNYQACSELILEPLTSEGLGFYVEEDVQIPEVERACRERFNVTSRPFWMPYSFGTARDMLRTARNIFFSDGEKDPWRVGGVGSAYNNTIHSSVEYYYIEGAAHHEDLQFHHYRTAPGVRKAKQLEEAAIRRWLLQSRQ
ncbi:hypothetical protein AAMO2058_001381200 [Amorphochlora amoebiformis]